MKFIFISAYDDSICLAISISKGRSQHLYLRFILIHIALGKLRDVYEIFTQQIKHYTKIDKNFLA